MKKNSKDIILDFTYYHGAIKIFFLKLLLDLRFILQKHRFPKRLTETQLREQEKNLIRWMEKDRKSRQANR